MILNESNGQRQWAGAKACVALAAFAALVAALAAVCLGSGLMLFHQLGLGNEPPLDALVFGTSGVPGSWDES